MVIVTTAAFPAESGKKMGERFVQVKPLPEFITRRGPYLTSNNTDGIISLSVYELDNDKLRVILGADVTNKKASVKTEA